MTINKKIRLRDCPNIREQVLKAWFRLDGSYVPTETERMWIDGGTMTATEHLEKLKNVVHYEPDGFRFLVFLSGWEACLINQKNKEKNDT